MLCLLLCMTLKMVSARKYRCYTAEEVLEMVDAVDSPSDFEIEVRMTNVYACQNGSVGR